MFKFFVVAARLFLLFLCVFPSTTSPNSGVKFFGGFSEVGENDFSVHFRRLCVFFLVFFSSAIARDEMHSPSVKGLLCEGWSGWGLAAPTTPLRKYTGVCSYVDEEGSAGKCQKSKKF